MLTLRTHIIICAALFAALIGIAIIGNVLQSAGGAPLSGTSRYIAMGVYSALFLAFGFSAIPVIVKLVFAAQIRINQNNPNISVAATAIHHQNTVIWTLWGIIGAGLLIAIPAALLGGMFGDAPRLALNKMFHGPNLGVLAARPDMTLDEMVQQSTVKIDLRYARSAISAGGVFDFVVPGTTIKLTGARYYYITTYDTNHARVRAVNVGTSPDKMSRAAVDSADDALRTLLANDGWLAGHEVYRTEEDQQLHGGVTQGASGRTWLKDGMILDINRNRMDDEQPGEDATTAGEWIQYVELWPAKDYSGFERFVFEPASAAK